ncbi:MAG: Tetratricopeptide 1 repeat-containing protein [Flaviaesturariibacter sp.]|nr:Tetratricopeptide 1 repeat-containing protein [Flaviaesturariibacter sp.]
MAANLYGQQWKKYYKTGEIHFKKNPTKALDNFYAAYELIIEDSINTLMHAACCNSIAQLHHDLGEYDTAEKFYGRAIVITTAILGKAHPSTLNYNTNLGMLYRDMGLYEKAETLLITTREQRKAVLGEMHLDYAGSSTSLGLLYGEMGQYEKEEQLLLEAHGLIEKTAGKKSLEYAASCSNLAALYFNTKRYEKAEPLNLESCHITEKLIGRKNLEYATTLGNLASLYNVMGDYKKAEPLQLEGKKIVADLLGKENLAYASYCYNLAWLYTKMGRIEKAEALFLENKFIVEKLLGKKSAAYEAACNNLAIVYWEEGNMALADTFFTEAFLSSKAQQQGIALFTNTTEKAAYLQHIRKGFDTYYSLYFSSPKLSPVLPFAISFQTRNLLLSSVQQLKRTVNEMQDTSTIHTYERWVAKKKLLAGFYTKGLQNRFTQDLEDSTARMEKELTQTSSAFAKVQDTKSWKDIQQGLSNAEAAIEFVDFNYTDGSNGSTDSNYYMALVLRPDRPQPLLIRLFEKRKLLELFKESGAVNSFYRGGDVSNSTVTSNALAYELIWAPLENALDGIKKIFYAPAGLLHKISFAALSINKHTVLSDKYQLLQLSTSAVLLNKEKLQVLPGDTIVLYGGVLYGADMALPVKRQADFIADSTHLRIQQFLRGDSWNYLEGTKTEVEGITVSGKKKGFSVKLYSGYAATEQSFNSLDGNASPAVLHIATHGFFFPNPQVDKGDGKLFQTNKQATVFTSSNDPLLRSGLLLAGANAGWEGKGAGGDDGILTAYEVSNLYLPNTKLVVLSACETGLGEVKGSEGVFGLQRAFKMAGVRYLLMSLWKVPDAESAEFMQELYKHLFEGVSIEEAFATTQTKLKNQYREDVNKWAAWVLIH